MATCSSMPRSLTGTQQHWIIHWSHLPVARRLEGCCAEGRGFIINPIIGVSFEFLRTGEASVSFDFVLVETKVGIFEFQPEPITGSTRMKGGTATKIILDAVFTLATNCRQEAKIDPWYGRCHDFHNSGVSHCRSCVGVYFLVQRWIALSFSDVLREIGRFRATCDAVYSEAQTLSELLELGGNRLQPWFSPCSQIVRDVSFRFFLLPVTASRVLQSLKNHVRSWIGLSTDNVSSWFLHLFEEKILSESCFLFNTNSVCAHSVGTPRFTEIDPFDISTPSVWQKQALWTRWGDTHVSALWNDHDASHRGQWKDTYNVFSNIWGVCLGVSSKNWVCTTFPFPFLFKRVVPKGRNHTLSVITIRSISPFTTRNGGKSMHEMLFWRLGFSCFFLGGGGFSVKSH